MKQSTVLEPALREFHWNDLVSLQIDVSYCRHRFIRTVNDRIASNTPPGIEDLQQLAQVDDLLKESIDRLEQAKTILFNLCYDSEMPLVEKLPNPRKSQGSTDDQG